ncbi:NUDIX domain-containing protein [Streptomyces sp. JJ66]|uniref:NUDIX hydrolase n=1 Tax=Streptomyces sp. JJ66 TaxID=2803843 RepID=UPI001C56CBDA|nr:NUDIX hydrolase [Streptomyces sp. JJ66]MBW1602096.1 NUDIX domain-containing protein [Streptomyces sp. JJ66]
MLVWLNGARGAAKSATARELLSLLPGSTLYDPRLVGSGLRGMLPPHRLARVADCRELPAWRRLVVDTAAALLSEVSGPLVTPMTLLRQEHRDEIFGGLAARRVPVRHFLLDADEAILRARVMARAGVRADTAAADAALGRHLDAYRQARAWLAGDAHTVDTGALTPRQAAEHIATALDAGAGACAIVQTPEPTAETVAAGVLLFDEQDRVLLVDPTYKPGWEFPGGVVERGEAPARAGVREVAEELGLRLPEPPRLLVVDWEPPKPPGFGGLRLLFDGGLLAEKAARELLLPSAELRGWRFAGEREAAGLLPPARLARLRWALRARERGRPLNLEAGVPVG